MKEQRLPETESRSSEDYIDEIMQRDAEQAKRRPPEMVPTIPRAPTKPLTRRGKDEPCGCSFHLGATPS